MENRSHAIVAICFLLILAVGAVFIAYWLSSGPAEPLAYRIVTSDSVSGLAAHSKVEFKGLPVGHVTRVHFDPSDRSRVIIDLHLRKGTYVTQATYAVAAMHGLTGGMTLDLKLGKGSSAPLQTSAEHPALIPMHKGLLAQLEASVKADMKAVHDVLQNAKKVLDTDNRKHLSATIRQIDEATAKLVKLETGIMPAAQRMPALVKSAQKSLAESHALLANANKLAREARGPVRKVGQVADTAQQLGRKLDKQTAPDIDALSRSLMRTSRQLQQLINELKAKPQSLIFGPAKPVPGPGEPGFQAGGNKGDQK